MLMQLGFSRATVDRRHERSFSVDHGSRPTCALHCFECLINIVVGIKGKKTSHDLPDQNASRFVSLIATAADVAIGDHGR
jgi:hypothetical protein